MSVLCFFVFATLKAFDQSRTHNRCISLDIPLYLLPRLLPLRSLHSRASCHRCVFAISLAQRARASPQMAGPGPSVLSEEMLRVIRGEVTHDEKKEQYKESLHRCVVCRLHARSVCSFEQELCAPNAHHEPLCV